MKLKVLSILVMVFTSSLFCKKSDVRIVSVTPTPQSEEVKIKIVYPEDNSIKLDNRIWIQVRLRGFPLGVISDFPRRDELATRGLGQSIHVIIDDKSYFPVTGPRLAPFDDEGDFYQSMYKFESPVFLKEGEHTIRAFPCRSYGECLKNPGSFDIVKFFVKKKKISKGIKLSKPYITYNEPTNRAKYKVKDPILLDFYLKNCDLSQDGYRVRVTIDGKKQRILFEWIPYYIYGLKSGKHTINLTLLDKKNHPVNNQYSSFTQTIYVE
jgi:hypothetical protein